MAYLILVPTGSIEIPEDRLDQHKPVIISPSTWNAVLNDVLDWTEGTPDTHPLALPSIKQLHQTLVGEINTYFEELKLTNPELVDDIQTIQDTITNLDNQKTIWQKTGRILWIVGGFTIGGIVLAKVVPALIPKMKGGKPF